MNILGLSVSPIGLLMIVNAISLIVLYFLKWHKQLPLIAGMGIGLAVTDIFFNSFESLHIPVYIIILFFNGLVLYQEYNKKEA